MAGTWRAAASVAHGLPRRGISRSPPAQIAAQQVAMPEDSPFFALFARMPELGALA